MPIVAVGIGLAKNDLAVHGVETTGQPVPQQPGMPRAKLAEIMVFTPLPDWLGRVH